MNETKLIILNTKKHKKSNSSRSDKLDTAICTINPHEINMSIAEALYTSFENGLTSYLRTNHHHFSSTKMCWLTGSSRNIIFCSVKALSNFKLINLLPFSFHPGRQHSSI